MDDHVDIGPEETAESGAKRAQRKRDRSGVCRKKGEEKEKGEMSTPQGRGHGIINRKQKSTQERGVRVTGVWDGPTHTGSTCSRGNNRAHSATDQLEKPHLRDE